MQELSTAKKMRAFDRRLGEWLALDPNKLRRLGLSSSIISQLSPAKFDQLFQLNRLSDQDFEKFCSRLSEIRRLSYEKYAEEFDRLLGKFNIPVVMEAGEIKEKIKKGKLPAGFARYLE